MPITINDQLKYLSFWKKYKRPPQEEYREKILDRVDLLVSQDMRERQGDFFTPRIYADRAIEYFAKALGEDWRERYYVWDCCCGTGNLLQDLKHQERIFASTLKKCHLRLIRALNRLANTPDSQLFQFDFLNDDWKPVKEGRKIPDKLFKIIKETPEKLVIYINPPYAEATSKKTISKSEKHKGRTAITKLKNEVAKNWGGGCSNELFIQFYYRIYKEITGCVLGCFSTLKNILGYNFIKYRQNFKAQWGGYIVPANTFDNVKGSFPISFQIWKNDGKTDFPKSCKFDVFNDKNELIDVKNVVSINNENEFLNKWMIKQFNKEQKNNYGWVNTHHGNDFSQSNYVWFQNECDKSCYIGINQITFRQVFIYVSVFTCIDHTWLNDRDQFTAPFEKIDFDVKDVKQKSEKENNKKEREEQKECDDEKKWREEIEQGKTEQEEQSEQNKEEQGKLYKKCYLYEDDKEFINDCIVYAIFTKNNTDWCLFDNSELGIYYDRDLEVWHLLRNELKKNGVSKEANDVYKSVLEIYKFYYNNKCGKNITMDAKYTSETSFKEQASLQDVLNRVKGQKVDKSGKLGRCSSCIAYPDAEKLFVAFRENLKLLADKIAKGVYKYGFLRE